MERQLKDELTSSSRESSNEPLEHVAPRGTMHYLRQSASLHICVARAGTVPNVFFSLVNEALHTIGDSLAIFFSTFVLLDRTEPE